jgi:hypothetical protein
MPLYALEISLSVSNDIGGIKPRSGVDSKAVSYDLRVCFMLSFKKKIKNYAWL